MTAQVVVILGPARAGKTLELLSRYQDALSSGPSDGSDRVLWLAPSARSVSLIRDSLVARGHRATLAPGVTTFDDLTKQIGFASNLKIHRISQVAARELVRRAIASVQQKKRLKFFAEAAQRSGFVDLVAFHIRELRERDVRPQQYERIASASSRDKLRHRELALLYTEYDRQLTTHGLCDAEGYHWAARDALTNGCSRFQNLELVVVDGFTDFTRTQHELLRVLASRTQQLLVSLPAEKSPQGGRVDLFAKTTATLAELKHFYPQLKEQLLASQPSATPALNHLSQHIFQHPQPPLPPPVLASTDSIEIIEAAGVQNEIVQLARHIKSRLAQFPLPFREGLGEGSNRSSARPTTPDDIVVVFRSTGELAPRIEEVFSRFGIPYSLESAPRIASAPVFRTLTNLLKLNADDWPFRKLIAVITNNALSEIDEAARVRTDWLVRDLQIASGREQLLAITADLAAQPIDSDEISQHRQRRIEAAIGAQSVLTKISDALANLPQQASPNEWVASIESLGTTLGIAAITPPSDPNSRDAAWTAISTHFAAIERLSVWLKESPPIWSGQDLLTRLIDIATKEPLPRPYDDVGRVRVLSAPTARAVPARHLYLAGMSEQAFPLSSRGSRLVTDGDYQFFASAAHQTSATSPSEAASAPSRSQDEMLLFYEVISRAQESLTISYPAMDEKAQVLPPSPYVIELKRMFAAAKNPIKVTPPQLSPVPPKDAIASIADWRVAAMSQAAQTDGDRHPLAGILSLDQTKSVGNAIDAGARIVHARSRGESFGPSEGVLISPAVAARLAQRFGPKHSWSPSQLETYASCPFKFFLQSVLQLEPLGDIALETDFAGRGSLLHQVLAAFHRKFDGASEDWADLWRDPARFATELNRTLQAAIDAAPREGIEAALLELDRRQIAKWTGQYHGQHETYDRAWEGFEERPRPTHFELRFGRKHADEAGHEDPNSVDKTFSLNIGDESINIAGRIDRIDVGRAGGQTVFNVIDYKSGRRPTLNDEKIASGERLQPALYVMAAKALIFGDENAAPLWAGYWSMKSGVNTQKKYSLHCSVETGELTDSWRELEPKVIARIGEIVHAARKGDFPVASRDPHCTSFCDFKTICRIAQVRSIGKALAADDPSAQPLDS